MASPSKEDAIVIVGAGVFGLTTALNLRRRGYEDVTVLDRMAPPVPDGSSCDISRIVRSDYKDPFYASIASEAISAWRNGPFARFYHNSSFVLTTEKQPDEYLENLKVVLRGQGQTLYNFHSTAELQERFPSLRDIKDDLGGYVNPNGKEIEVFCGICDERF